MTNDAPAQSPATTARTTQMRNRRGLSFQAPSMAEHPAPLLRLDRGDPCWRDRNAPCGDRRNGGPADTVDGDLDRSRLEAALEFSRQEPAITDELDLKSVEVRRRSKAEFIARSKGCA